MHASIMGMPVIGDADAKEITKAVLALRMKLTGKKKQALSSGSMKLTCRPLKYRSMVSAWLEQVKEGEDWTTKPEPFADNTLENWPLRSLICPECKKERKVEQKLNSKAKSNLFSPLYFASLIGTKINLPVSGSRWRYSTSYQQQQVSTEVPTVNSFAFEREYGSE